MQLIPNATIRTSHALADIYQEAMRDELGWDEAPAFPLDQVHIVHIGDRITLGLPVPHSRHFQLDALTDATSTVVAGRRGDETVLTGTSTRLLNLGVAMKDARIEFVVAGDNVMQRGVE